MNMMLDETHLHTIGDIETFLHGTNAVQLSFASRKERSEWIRHTFTRFKYFTLARCKKHILLQYISKLSQLSHAQIARHVHAYKQNIPLFVSKKHHSFACLYSNTDIELLAETDHLHGRLNGSATIALMNIEYDKGDNRYYRLRGISTSRLYDLRKKRQYIDTAITIEKTNPVQIPIGERRKPLPNGTPGYIRVDTVHQGDYKGQKGVYHINFVDEVTQWEVIVSVEKISEAYIQPALEQAFSSFPFSIINFHSDNGSEYINEIVKDFLQRFHVRQTKGRPRHSNDNGLVETKNGAIIRKHMSHYHISQPFASRINEFYTTHLVPYLNYYRPCAFPTTVVEKNGKKIVTYPPKNYRTPYQKLTSLEHWERYLRRGITSEQLKKEYERTSPNQAAKDMQDSKGKLFHIILPRYDV